MDRLATRTAGTEVVIHQGRLQWGGRPDDAAPALGPALPAVRRIEALRNIVVLITVCLPVPALQLGFMQLRIPGRRRRPADRRDRAVPVADHDQLHRRPGLSLTVAILPLAIWWTFGVGRALFDFAIHGTWALRDAAHVLESLFLLVGFVFAGDPRSLERFFDWLPSCC